MGRRHGTARLVVGMLSGLLAVPFLLIALAAALVSRPVPAPGKASAPSPGLAIPWSFLRFDEAGAIVRRPDEAKLNPAYAFGLFQREVARDPGSGTWAAFAWACERVTPETATPERQLRNVTLEVDRLEAKTLPDGTLQMHNGWNPVYYLDDGTIRVMWQCRTYPQQSLLHPVCGGTAMDVARGVQFRIEFDFRHPTEGGHVVRSVIGEAAYLDGVRRVQAGIPDAAAPPRAR